MDSDLKIFLEQVLKLAADFEKKTKSKLQSIDIYRERMKKDGTYDEKLDSCPVIFYAERTLENGRVVTELNGLYTL
jgi:hypothetical protein